jgi:hypothetical protein
MIEDEDGFGLRILDVFLYNMMCSLLYIFSILTSLVLISTIIILETNKTKILIQPSITTSPSYPPSFYPSIQVRILSSYPNVPIRYQHNAYHIIPLVLKTYDMLSDLFSLYPQNENNSPLHHQVQLSSPHVDLPGDQQIHRLEDRLSKLI